MRHSWPMKVLALLTLITVLVPLFVFAREANDPEILRQKYLELIHVRDAWDRTVGSRQVVVAVIDTGVDIDHPDLQGNIWTNTDEIADNGIDDDNNGFIDDVHGWDFVDDDADPAPSGQDEGTLMHGTAVSGIIGAVGNNEEGIAGVAWKVQIMPLRMLGENGMGTFDDAAKAVRYAVANGAGIINFSLAGTAENDSLRRAIRDAYAAGVVVVSAVGNEGDNMDDTPYYPACLRGVEDDWVIGVTATDLEDRETEFTNYGRDCADVAAPGTEFYSLTHGLHGEAFVDSWEGTSASAPVVSGVVALLRAVYPGLSPADVRLALKLSVDPISETISGTGAIGVGRVNAARALQLAADLPTAGNPPYTIPSESPDEDVPADRDLDQGVSDDAAYSFVVTGAPAGAKPQVRLYNADGRERSVFMAYGENFLGGVNVAVENLSDDWSGPEIVTGAGPGGGPHVRVFTQTGVLIHEFFAYDPASSAGVSVAVGDVVGDGSTSILTAVGAGVSNDVVIWDLSGKELLRVPATGFAPGVSLGAAVADVDDDYDPELIIYAREGSSRVQVWNLPLNEDGEFQAPVEWGAFEAFPRSTAGVTVATVDVNSDFRDEVAVASKDEGTVRVFTPGGALVESFAVAEPGVGVVITGADIDINASKDVVAVPNVANADISLWSAVGARFGVLVPGLWQVGSSLAAW